LRACLHARAEDRGDATIVPREKVSSRTRGRTGAYSGQRPTLKQRSWTAGMRIQQDYGSMKRG